MTSFNGLLPPCEKCGHRNPIGFGLEKQIRKEEEAKYLKKEKAYETKLSEMDKAYEAKLSEKDQAYEAKLSEKDQAFKARFSADKKNLEIELNRKSKEFIDSYQEKENLKFQSKFEKLKTDYEKHYFQKAKEAEDKSREILSALNLKNSTEIHKKDKEIQTIKHTLETISKDYEIKNINKIQTIKEEAQKEIQTYKNQISILENDNKNLKEYRSGHSKINGNNLEEHILNEAAFHINMGLRGSIEKDTSPVKRGMVDFIYRGFDNQGNKVIEVGIEVKNESLDSSHTQKNIKHLPKFEKNCNDKNLEYKILVSTLEPGNKLFDDGIYRVPNYKNMYVCRPQHLMAFLGLLTDQASERFKDLETLKQARESNFQVEVIQDNMSTFRFNFLKEISDWEGSYDSALKLIETIMQKLNKLKLELLNGRNSIKYLTDKVENFNIKNLTTSGKLLQSSQVVNK